MKETWTKSKYSLNIEEAPKSNEKTIRKNHAKNKQLVTQLQSNNGVT